MQLTDEQRAFEALAKEAAPLPWTLEVEELEYAPDGSVDVGTILIPEIKRMLHDIEWAESEDWKRDLANGTLIVEGLNYLPALLAENKRLREALAAAPTPDDYAVLIAMCSGSAERHAMMQGDIARYRERYNAALAPKPAGEVG